MRTVNFTMSVIKVIACFILIELQMTKIQLQVSSPILSLPLVYLLIEFCKYLEKITQEKHYSW